MVLTKKLVKNLINKLLDLQYNIIAQQNVLVYNAVYTFMLYLKHDFTIINYYNIIECKYLLIIY